MKIVSYKKNKFTVLNNTNMFQSLWILSWPIWIFQTLLKIHLMHHHHPFCCAGSTSPAYVQYRRKTIWVILTCVGIPYLSVSDHQFKSRQYMNTYIEGKKIVNITHITLYILFPTYHIIISTWDTYQIMERPVRHIISYFISLTYKCPTSHTSSYQNNKHIELPTNLT